MTGQWSADWLVLPDGSAIHHADLSPCPCGNHFMRIVRCDYGMGRWVGCLACIRLKASDRPTKFVVDMRQRKIIASESLLTGEPEPRR